MPPSLQQEFAAGEELRTAVRLIKAGIKSLHEIGGANDFYTLPLLTLCTGFERLMKITLCFRIHATTGEFPDKDYVKRFGHDLEKLLRRVRSTCIVPRCEATPIVREDLNFIESDDHLRRLIVVLSQFAKAARYYNLDVVTGDAPDTESPDREWERLETDILRALPGWDDSLRSSLSLDATYAKVNHQIAYRLEHFARALARLYTHGELGPLAQRWGNPLMGFAMKDDEELGTRTP